jgi:hypothetical protein
MNWKEEIERVGFCVINYDYDTLYIGYTIGEVEFYVEVDYWKEYLNQETGIYDIGVKAKKGEWWIESEDSIRESNPIEFGDDYNKWIYGMMDYLINEDHYMAERFFANDDELMDFDEWSLYGI